MQQNAIKNLKNGLFGVKFDGESAELWRRKSQGHGLFQNRYDFGSFGDLFLGAVYIYIYIYILNMYACMDVVLPRSHPQTVTPRASGW